MKFWFQFPVRTHLQWKPFSCGGGQWKLLENHCFIHWQWVTSSYSYQHEWTQNIMCRIKVTEILVLQISIKEPTCLYISNVLFRIIKISGDCLSLHLCNDSIGLFYYWNSPYMLTESLWYICVYSNINKHKIWIFLKYAIQFTSREQSHCAWLYNFLLSSPVREDDTEEERGTLWLRKHIQAVRIARIRIISYQQGGNTFIQRKTENNRIIVSGI